MSKLTPKKLVLFARKPCLVLLGVIVFGLVTLSALWAPAKPVSAATSSTINFQARLLTNAGSLVPDGNYNVEFKIYDASSSSGSSQGSCTGDAHCLWTETRTSTNQVRVANGYLTVNLGSVTSFPSINWDQQLWLSMNIGGTSGSPSWDGEMSPRLQLTAVPYAFRAGQLATNNSGNIATLSFSAPSANETILLPTTTGTQYVCYQNDTNCGFASASGSSNYVNLQGSSPGTAQTGNFNITGTGIAGALQAATLDTSGTLSLGNSTATTVNIANNAVGHTVNIATDSSTAQAVTIGSTNASSTLLLQGGSTASLQTGASGTVNVGTTAQNETIQIGTTATNTSNTQTIGIGNTNNAGTTNVTIGTGSSATAGTTTIQGKTSVLVGNATTPTITLQTGASGNINVGTNAVANTIQIGINGTNTGNTQAINIGNQNAAGTTNVNIGTGSSATGGTTNVQSKGALTLGNSVSSSIAVAPISGGNITETTTGAGTITLNTATSIVAKTTANTSTAFQVQNALAAPVFTVDTTSTTSTGSTLNYLAYPGFETGSFNNASTGWNSVSPGTLSQNATKSNTYNGINSAQLATTSSNGGITTSSFYATPSTTGTYTVSFYAKLSSGSMAGNAFTVTSTDGASHTCNPSSGVALSTSGFQRLSCSVTTTGTITALSIAQNDGTARTIYIDAVQLQLSSSATPYQIGAIQLRGVITSPVAIMNSGDSTAAFQIQNAAGTSNLFVADTLNGRIGIGTNSPGYALDVVGDINTTTALRIGGTSVCDTSGTTGCIAKSGSGYYIHNQTTVQSANLYVQAATTGTVAATFQAFNGGTGDIADFLNGSGTTVGSISSTGAALFKPSTNSATAFQVQPSASSTPVLDVDTSNSRVGIGTNAPSRAFDVAVNNTQITAPPVLIEQAGTGDANIELKTADAASNYYVGVDTSNADAFTINSYTAATTGGSSYTLGTTVKSGSTDSNANVIEATEFTSSSAGTVSAITIDMATLASGGDTISAALYADNSGVPGNLLAHGSPQTFTISNPGGDNFVTVNIPTTSISASTTYWLTFNTSGSDQYWIANSGSGHHIYYTNSGQANTSWPSPYPSNGAPSNNSATTISAVVSPTVSLTDVNSNALFTMSQTGNTTFKNSTNSTSAFQVQNASSTSILKVDTTNSVITLNGAVTGGAVNDSFTDSSATTHIDATPALAYYLSTTSGTTNTTFNSTVNLTGLPSVDGSFIFVTAVATKGATTGSQSHSTIVQIGGTPISTVTTATGTGSSTNTRTFTMVRTNGTWRPAGEIGTSVTAASSTSTTADLAEWIPYTGDQPEAGDVLMVGDGKDASAKKSNSAYNTKVIGVVTTTPGQVFGLDDGHSTPMALTGRVPVKVSLENGPIHAGDYLTSSSTPGVAMRATKPGRVIGTALTGYDGTGDAKVMTQLGVGYNIPDDDEGASSLQGSNADTAGSGEQTNTSPTQSAVQSGQGAAPSTIDGLKTRLSDVQQQLQDLGTRLSTGDIQTDILTVTGDAEVRGVLTANTVVSRGDLTVGGHFITSGNAPTVALQDSAGSADQDHAKHVATASVTGNDTSGELSITIGDLPADAKPGDLIKVTFNKKFASAPRIFLTPGNKDALALQAYVSNVTDTDFTLTMTASTLPTPGQTYQFGYFTVQ